VARRGAYRLFACQRKHEGALHTGALDCGADIREPFSGKKLRHLPLSCPLAQRNQGRAWPAAQRLPGQNVLRSLSSEGSNTADLEGPGGAGLNWTSCDRLPIS